MEIKNKQSYSYLLTKVVVNSFKLRYHEYNCLKMPNKKIILSIKY